MRLFHWCTVKSTLSYPTNIDDYGQRITVVFEPGEEGGYTAFIPEVPGAVSEGETIEEAREMVLDALRELTQYRREVALKRQDLCDLDRANCTGIPANFSYRMLKGGDPFPSSMISVSLLNSFFRIQSLSS